MKTVTIKKYEKVRSLIANGEGLRDALKKVRMATASYYTAKKNLGTKIVVHEAPKKVTKKYKKAVQESSDFVIITTASNLRSVLGELR